MEPSPNFTSEKKFRFASWENLKSPFKNVTGLWLVTLLKRDA